MRALIVTAGLLVVAGTAAAASAQPATVRHSPSPVEAVAQDGGLLAWLSGDGSKCNVVHVSGRGTNELLPRPATGSMTCHWDLSAGAQQLAIAAGSAEALWTLHESGSVPFDYVMSAQVGGKEVQVDRLAHDSDGTGWWLGGLAGGGKTLAYSSVEVEYVDKLGCASGGSCKKKIAGGAIQFVSAGHATPLANSLPALDLAVSDGRIAYVPATAVAKNGTPVPSSSANVQVADIAKGTFVQAKPVGVPLAVALASRVLAVLTRGARNTRLTWYDPATGTKQGGIAVSGKTSPELAANNAVVVYRVGRVLRVLVVATGRTHVLASVAGAPVGLSLYRSRLVWAENRRASGDIRSLTVG